LLKRSNPKQGEKYMGRSEFLKEISSMNREEINNYLMRNCKRVKKIYPIIILKGYDKKEKERKENEGRRTN
jgi:hypothetical protein